MRHLLGHKGGPSLGVQRVPKVCVARKGRPPLGLDGLGGFGRVEGLGVRGSRAFPGAVGKGPYQGLGVPRPCRHQVPIRTPGSQGRARSAERWWLSQSSPGEGRL